MLKVTIVLGAILVIFVAESTCQKFILPTFRPPRRKPVIRHVRDVSDLTPIASEGVPVPLLLEEPFLDRTARSLDSPSAKRGGGSHSTSSGSRDTGATHPGYNRRNARSLDSPSAKRGGGSSRTLSGSRNTGPTHPGYNRRNAREIRLPGHLNPLRPKPLFPRPSLPQPVPQLPIYARTTRDIQNPSFEKPSHSDAVMQNWNPHVKNYPGRGRHGRSIDRTEEFEVLPHERVAREVQISGLPRKPTHRDVIIPNWNPHVKTNPWNNLGGRGRHARSIDRTEEFVVLPHKRGARDVQISGLPIKPTHRDVIIPNWNPHVKTNPWNNLGGRGRHARSIDRTEEFEVLPHKRVARDVQISGLPRKPTHRDVIIPNWNPHVKTNPWNNLGGRGRHARSIDRTEEFEVLPHKRVARDVQISGLPIKPTHRDVIIPNWNPHVKTNPWNSLGVKGRH